MGTNYYATKTTNHCLHCNRSDKQKWHIGKSSAGWCFSLHVIPEENLYSLEDWIKFLQQPDVDICDENERFLLLPELLTIIAQRSWNGSSNNLKRHTLDDSHCVGHAKGTWDLITGEFS